MQEAGPALETSDKVFQLLPVPPRYREVEGEVMLWRAVIDRALKDILEGEELEAARARGWFRGVKSIREEVNGWSSGFADVCDMACLDPRWVRNWVTNHLSTKGLSL